MSEKRCLSLTLHLPPVLTVAAYRPSNYLFDSAALHESLRRKANPFVDARARMLTASDRFFRKQGCGVCHLSQLHLNVCWLPGELRRCGRCSTSLIVCVAVGLHQVQASDYENAHIHHQARRTGLPRGRSSWVLQRVMDSTHDNIVCPCVHLRFYYA